MTVKWVSLNYVFNSSNVIEINKQYFTDIYRNDIYKPGII